MKSLPVAVLALLAIVGFAAWFVFSASEEDAPLPSAGATPKAQAHREDGVRAPAERTEVPPPAVTPGTTPSRPAEPTAQPPIAAVAKANVILRVHDASSQQPLATFRWRIRSEGAKTGSGTGTDGHADLLLPAGLTFELLVEADAYSPFTAPQLAVPATDAPPLEIAVPLESAAVATGITLHVHEVGLPPIPNVRVEAFALRPEDRDLAWYVLNKPVWVRRSAAADGEYVLPELAAGEYGIRVLATDAQGELLPLLPFTHTYVLTGSNSFVEDVTLEPGCLPLLELFDASGQPIDPQHGVVTLGLRLPGGPMIARQWVQKRDTGQVRAVDALPGVGVTWPAGAVAAGTWQLDILIDGQPALQRQLLLRAGERQAERIFLPQ